MRVGARPALDRRQRIEHALRQLAGAAAADGEATVASTTWPIGVTTGGGAAGEGLGQAGRSRRRRALSMP